MSIYDSKIYDDWREGYLIQKIKEAEDKYYKESPCLHCGPGNVVMTVVVVKNQK